MYTMHMIGSLVLGAYGYGYAVVHMLWTNGDYAGHNTHTSWDKEPDVHEE